MGKKKRDPQTPADSPSFDDTYPNIAAWVSNGGQVEIGYEPRTGSFVRALDEGGLIWEGVSRYEALDYALRALDRGIADWTEENG